MIKLKAFLITLTVSIGAVGTIVGLRQLDINQVILILQLILAVGGAIGLYLTIKEGLEEKEYKRKEEENRKMLEILRQQQEDADIDRFNKKYRMYEYEDEYKKEEEGSKKIVGELSKEEKEAIIKDLKSL